MSEMPKNAYVLPEEVAISSVDLMQESFGSMEIGDFAVAAFDASKVQIFTTPAVQLLLAFEKTLDLLDGHLELWNPSEAMQRVFKLLGLEETFNKWSKFSA